MKTKSITLLALFVLLAVVSASIVYFSFPYEPDNPPLADSSNSTVSGMQKVVDANNEFAFDLYKKLDSENNLFYSPYSISSALAMTYEGAKGQTAEEMKSVFHFPENNVLRPNFAAIYNDINKADKPYELKTGNALWVQQDFHFLEDYLSTVEKYYGGKAANLDFVSKTEESRQTINNFIEEQTNNKIKDLIPEGVLGPDTKLVLTNAIYFKGDWVWQFDKSKTLEEDFKITPENKVTTKMMHMNSEKNDFNYTKNDNLQILELPYKGDEISMLILLPKENLKDLESELTLKNLKDWKSQMKETSLEYITMPKFEFDTKSFMKETLSDLGMSTAFSPSADFSGMDGARDLMIDEVIHQAYVKVDEEGTEAAAATAVVMSLSSIRIDEPKYFNADHPFIFVIQERKTGNILFMGRIVDPTKAN